MLGYSLLGVIIWILISVGLRTWGHLVLNVHNSFLTTVFFGSLFAILPLGGVFRMMISPTAKLSFPMIVISIALPGMVMDTFVVLYYREFFPNLVATSLPMFMAWSTLAYCLILLNGLIYRR